MVVVVVVGDNVVMDLVVGIDIDGMWYVMLDGVFVGVVYIGDEIDFIGIVVVEVIGVVG